MELSKKIDWIDNLKGLAILAVVVGHLATPYTRFIFAWHMPLFLFISGYLLKESKVDVLVRKDFRRLIVPYYVFGLVAIVIEWIKRVTFPNFPFLYSEFSFIEELKSLFIWMDAGRIHTYGFALWFLPALCFSKIFVLGSKNIFKTNYVALMIGLWGWFVLSNQKEVWIFGLDKAWFSLVWVACGKIYRDKLTEYVHLSKLGIGLILLFLYFLPVPLLNMAFKISEQPLYSVAYSLLIIFWLISVFKTFKALNIFREWGNNSMFVYFIHPYSNNMVYILVIQNLKQNWFVLVIGSVMFLYILLLIRRNMKSLFMVLDYIFRNNKTYEVPWKILYSSLIIFYQSVFKKDFVKTLTNNRKIWIFNDCVVSRMFIYCNIPDREEVDLLRKDITPETIFLDVGANVGSYSVLMSDLTKNIYGFEPTELSNFRCKKNFVLNNLKESNVLNTALSDKVGKAGFIDFGGTSTVNRLADSNNANFFVDTDTLDNWVKQNKMFNKTLVLKIDVEGNEEKVINGAEKCLKRGMIKSMIIEIFDKENLVFKKLAKYRYLVRDLGDNNYYVFKK